MNIITVAGNIGKDAEIRNMPNGDPVASFSVADSQGRDKPTIWWNCQLFGKRAQALAPYLLKGQQVTVAGSVSEREWTDKDGQKRKSMDVRVNEVALQGGRKDATEAPRQAPQQEQGGYRSPVGRPIPASQPRQTAPTGSGFDDMDDDIPF